MSLQSAFDTVKNQPIEEFSKQLKKNVWNSSDVMTKISFTDYSYSLEKENSQETENGIYSLQTIGNYIVIQFLSDLDSTVLHETYSLEFGEKTITEKVNKKTVEKIVTDYDTIIFSPVKITTTDCYASEGKIFTLTPVQE